jgi:hypothetical protein
MNSLFLALLLVCSANTIASGECKCVRAKPSETTRWGGNIHIVVQESESYPSMRGVVLDHNGTRLRDVLVEVFDHPEGLLLPYPQNREAELKQQRIAACKTGEAGRFCFPGLAHGKYELRCSFGPGWDVTSVYVVIAPHHGRVVKKELKVQMHLGV